jgi:hypothetical protein
VIEQAILNESFLKILDRLESLLRYDIGPRHLTKVHSPFRGLISRRMGMRNRLKWCYSIG